MAKTGETYILSDEQKELALLYVRASGFYKTRLAAYLKISRPTLDRVIKDDAVFFTDLESASADFCKELIERVKEKDPKFILRTRYREEFNDSVKFEKYDPEVVIQNALKTIDEYSR